MKKFTFSHHPNRPFSGKNVSFGTKNKFYGQIMEIKVLPVEKPKSLTYSKYFYGHRVSQKSKLKIDF